ncbi:DUF1624 domain-containing protein [Rhodobacteraceae bacterium]|nr:DUF1624 domain-containing protein [Paracoccaceae bacterium]
MATAHGTHGQVPINRCFMSSSRRLLWPDLARTIALLAMASFHFGIDLQMLSIVQVLPAWWPDYARAIAGSFLFLVGISLWLANAGRIRWPANLKRLAMIVAGAAAVTGVTYLAMPGYYVYFGILHSIAIASVLGLAFLRLPAIATMALGLLALMMPFLFATPLMNAPWLWWVGLSTQWGSAMDFVPVFPWFGMVLLGLGCAKLADRFGLLRQDLPKTGWLHAVSWPGRHSLAVYLIHQPVIYGLLWLWARQKGYIG